MEVPSPEWDKVLADSQSCKEAQKLERASFITSGYEYDIDDEMVAELEELDPTGKTLEKHCTNLAEVEERQAIADKAYEDHMKVCPQCKPYFDQVLINRQDLAKCDSSGQPY